MSARAGRRAGAAARLEGDDFGGLRAWRPGESQRHIDWKAAARGQALLIKQWAGDARRDAAARLGGHRGGSPTRRGSSQLARWVVLAERGGRDYGLRAAGRERSPPGTGEAHYHECLRALRRLIRREEAAA